MAVFISFYEEEQKTKNRVSSGEVNKHHLSDDLIYSPETCKNSDNKVYFASGPDVFSVPHAYPVKILANTQPEQSLESVDSTQPAGCFENPISGRSFGFAFKPENPEEYPPGTPFKVCRFSLITTKPGYWGTQKSNEQRYKKIKEKYNWCEELDNGLVWCKAISQNHPENSAMWGGVLKAKESVYRAPLDRPFIVGCLPKFANGYQQCDVTYNYTSRLRVTYRFSLDEMPILEIIEFDKALRMNLEQMKVGDYPWR